MRRCEMTSRKPDHKPVLDALDKQTVAQFIALCERNGAAERVREMQKHVEAIGPGNQDLFNWDLLGILGLTALLSEPEPCARCGGTGRERGDVDDHGQLMWIDCPACGGAR